VVNSMNFCCLPNPNPKHCLLHLPSLPPGRGSVLTLKGRHELEASVMTDDGRCGAAALLTKGARGARALCVLTSVRRYSVEYAPQQALPPPPAPSPALHTCTLSHPPRAVRNPVLLARSVMETTPHIFLAGPSAEEFAAERGLELVEENGWFTTEQRRRQWEEYVRRGALAR
jgi:isoaspartyl peptidase/L-asparaginase-like protein (Ntn-hydrolase superfamily)